MHPSLLPLLLVAGEAQAVDVWAPEPRGPVEPAWQAFFNAHLVIGQSGVGLGVGADLLAGPSFIVDGDTGIAVVAGPFVQADVTTGGGHVALSAGGRAGPGVVSHGDFGGVVPWGLGLGEVGATWSPAGSGLRVGGHLRSIAFDLGFSGVRTEGRFGRLDGTAGLSLALAPPAYVVAGRPLRTGEGAVLPPAVVARPTPEARRWLQRAREEAGAALAFQRLVAELHDAGAPAALIARAARAALEERAHTRLCLAQAARFGGGARLLLPAAPPPRPAPSHTQALARIAWEGRWDGHDNEGRAAEQAAAAAARSRDARSRAVEARIARDEHGHALLGEGLTAWAVTAGGRPVLRALDGPPV